MEIRLSPEVELAVRRGVDAGGYSSVEDYVTEAVDLMRSRQYWREESPEEFEATTQASIAEGERGEVANEDQVRREMQEMKAAWIYIADDSVKHADLVEEAI